MMQLNSNQITKFWHQIDCNPSNLKMLGYNFDIVLLILDILGYLITLNPFPILDNVKKKCILVNFDPKMTQVNFNGIL